LYQSNGWFFIHKKNSMRKITFLAIFFITSLAVTAQETPSVGFMFSRITTAQRLAMPTTIAKGVHVFDTDTNSDWFYNGSSWVQNATAGMASKWTNNAGKVSLTNQSNGTTARTASNRLEITDTGDLYTGGGLVPTTGFIELGQDNATGGDRNSYLDFHAKDGTDYDARLIRNAGTNGSLSLVNQGSGGLFLGNNGANQMLINASGNVGIGTSTPGSDVGMSGGLTINGTNSTQFTIQKNGVSGLAINTSNSTTGDVDFFDRVGGTFNRAITLNSGRVGIGTSTPTGKLQINNSLGYFSVDDSGVSQARFVAGAFGSMIRNDGGSTYFLLTNVNDQNGGWNSLRPFTINNATGDVYLANSSGNVGIGTASPAQKLQVNGNIKVNGIVDRFNRTGSAGQILINDGSGLKWEVPTNVVRTTEIGVISSTGSNDPLTVINSYTGTYIDLGPGKWMVNGVFLIGFTTALANGEGYWIRTSLSDSNTILSPSIDIMGGTLISGSLMGPAYYGTVSGSIIINNSSATVKRYYYYRTNTNTFGTGVTSKQLSGFGSSGWNENNLFAIPIE
jgi:hypothetical protein